MVETLLPTTRPTTRKALVDSGYSGPVSVRQEIARNVASRLREKKQLLPGILGYEDSVVPSLEAALLAGHDVVLLGERGQAKSRIARSLIDLLDEAIPVVDGCEIHDDPLAPQCARCRVRLKDEGDLPVRWIGPKERYIEKLATPDATVSDLIGEMDPIRIAEGRYLSDETTMHFGLVPRAHRGILVINELPDLTERLQVALLTAMEEGDIQIRGYLLRISLDTLLVATANPEDYTSRGRIITPLKDRFGAQIRTHYPKTHEAERAIVEQEVRLPEMDEVTVEVPSWVYDVIVATIRAARVDPRISTASGVSLRAAIDWCEASAALALRRALVSQVSHAVVRMSDLRFAHAALEGKLEPDGWEASIDVAVIDSLMDAGVKAVAAGRYASESAGELPSPEALIEALTVRGRPVSVGSDVAAREYRSIASDMPIPDEKGAALVEWLLEVGVSRGQLSRSRTPESALQYISCALPTS